MKFNISQQKDAGGKLKSWFVHPFFIDFRNPISEGDSRLLICLKTRSILKALYLLKK